VVHLFEERGKVLGLGDRDVVTKLEHPLVVPRAPLCGGGVTAAGTLERALHDRQKLQLLANDSCPFGVVVEAFDGMYDRGRGGYRRASLRHG
jgi:hypothetical protein